jgi:hypothetical protein
MCASGCRRDALGRGSRWGEPEERSGEEGQLTSRCGQVVAERIDSKQARGVIGRARDMRRKLLLRSRLLLRVMRAIRCRPLRLRCAVTWPPLCVRGRRIPSAPGRRLVRHDVVCSSLCVRCLAHASRKRGGGKCVRGVRIRKDGREGTEGTGKELNREMGWMESVVKRKQRTIP